MQVARLTTLMLGAGFIAGCGGDSNFPTVDCSKATTAHCVEVRGGDSAALLTQVNSIDADTTIVLGAGKFAMTNQITINTAGTHLIGQGIEQTTLDFGATTTQSDGIYTIGNDFLVQDLT